MNEKVQEFIKEIKKENRIIYEKQKSEFAKSIKLTEKQYATYEIKCKGYDIDENDPNNLISFTMKTNKTLNINDIIPIVLNGAKKKICLTEFEYGKMLDDFSKFDCSEQQEDVNGKHIFRRYKRIPIDITDEEYETLKELYSERENVKTCKTNPSGENGISTILYIIAALMIFVGFIGGFGIAEETEGIIGFSIAMVIFIQAMLIIALGKIIDLLTVIMQKK